MRNELSKSIQRICEIGKVRSNPKQVFDDLMILGFNLIYSNQLNAYTRNYHHVACNEDFVIELKDYKKCQKSWELLQESFQFYMKDIANNEPFDDVIGLQYDEYLGKTLGQFLTPKDVADGCFLFGHADKISKNIENKEHFNMVDFCSGAGALVLAALRFISKEYDKEGMRYIHLLTNDIDENMIRMCSVQIILSSIFHNLPLGSYEALRSNAITEYDTKRANFVMRAVRNQFDYNIYKTKLNSREVVV